MSEGSPEETDQYQQLLQKVQHFTLDDNERLTAEETKHADLVKQLLQVYEVHGHIDLPRSLDEYFHESIDDIDVNLRNGDQVISRFIARKRIEWEKVRSRRSSQQQHQNTNAATVGQSSAPAPQSTQTPSRLEAGLGDSDLSQTREATEFRQRIITVPKFWVWKLDGKHEHISPRL